jgi:hypothetical protein
MTKKILRASADDDSVAGAGDLIHQSLGMAHDGVGVEQLELMDVRAAVEAAAYERRQQPIIQRTDTFFAALDLLLFTVARRATSDVSN